MKASAAGLRPAADAGSAGTPGTATRPHTSPRAAGLLGMLAALPFTPKVLAFGLVVGVASRAAGWHWGELTLAAVGINAATAQLAALEFRDTTTLAALAALTLGLNAKHLIFSASLWPHLRRGRPWRVLAATAMLTDSSWAACHLAAQRGRLDDAFALANTLALSLVWLVGCLLGHRFGAVLSPAMLETAGLDALVPLSMAVLLPLSCRRDAAQALPIAAGAGLGGLVWWASGHQAAAVLVGGVAGALATLAFNRRVRGARWN